MNEVKSDNFIQKDGSYYYIGDDVSNYIEFNNELYRIIKVNNEDAEDRMNDFLCEIMDFFELPKPEFKAFSQWEKDRDNFLRIVNNIKYNGGQRLGKWL